MTILSIFVEIGDSPSPSPFSLPGPSFPGARLPGGTVTNSFLVPPFISLLGVEHCPQIRVCVALKPKEEEFCTVRFKGRSHVLVRFAIFFRITVEKAEAQIACTHCITMYRRSFWGQQLATRVSTAGPV